MRIRIYLLAALLLGVAAAAATASEEIMDGVTFEWDYEGAALPGESSGEARRLLATPKPGRFHFFIFAVALNKIKNTCSSFSPNPEPRPMEPPEDPSKSYRKAIRDMVNEVTGKMGLDGGRLRKLRIKCREARVTNNNQRKNLRMEVVAAIPPEKQAEFSRLIKEYIEDNTFSTQVCFDLEAGIVDPRKWCPRSTSYVNKLYF